jgi:hypothetical protein
MASHRLHPHRALVHPLWVGALVVLALNDHWWKYADLLPAPVTGKLSDFAGLLVAPVLLAAIVGVRARAGLFAAHVAVGVVFTLIQVSRSCADAWSALMDLVAVPWIITSDPTDLVALPVLALGMHVYPRVMQRRAVASLRRTGETAGAAIGLVCCVATSRPPEDGEPVYPPIDADVYINNDTDEELVVRIRPIATDVFVDCDTVAADPGRLLAAPLFDTAQSWSVPADGNVAVHPSAVAELDGGCHAAIVDADGWPSRLVFWRTGQPARTQVSGTGIDSAAPGWIRMSRDEDDRGLFEAEMEILFELEDSSDGEGTCAVQDDGDRNEWSAEVPVGSWSIAALDAGLDGCTAFGLAASHDTTESVRWYLCTPALELPFAVGDAIDIEVLSGIGLDGVRVRAIDLATHDAAFPARELVVSRGSEVAAIADLSTSFVAEFDCPFTVDACGTVARAGVLVVGGSGWPSAEIAAGETAVLEHGSGAVVRIALAHGQDREVVDDECALGPAGPGVDVEIAASYVGAAD